ncbi:MAG: hypothetical protein ACLQF0_15805 [Dissulfurispiraceae bacterium]
MFFDALKLRSSGNPYVFMAAIHESVLRSGSALLALVTVDPCIASKNKCSPSPAVYFIESNYIRSGSGRLFIGAMHGSTVTRASNAEPQLRMGMDNCYYNLMSLAMNVVSALR